MRLSRHSSGCSLAGKLRGLLQKKIERLLGMTVDEKLTWTPHMLELKKSFAKKGGLLTKSRFLPRNVRQDLYFKVILPSVTYGRILWGSWCNSDLFQSLERLLCRAARLIFNLPKDMASVDVLQLAQCQFIINQPFLSVFIKLLTIGYLSH